MQGVWPLNDLLGRGGAEWLALSEVVQRRLGLVHFSEFAAARRVASELMEEPQSDVDSMTKSDAYWNKAYESLCICPEHKQDADILWKNDTNS